MASDANWDKVVLLLQSGAGTFLDLSPSAATISYSGSSLVTTQTKFGTVCLQPAYTYLPNSAEYDFGGNDFEIEAWVYLGSTPSPYAALIGNIYDAGPGGWRVLIDPSGYVRFGGYWTGQTTLTDTTGATLGLNQWANISAAKSGNTLTTFVNGAISVQSTATSFGTLNASTASMELGGTAGANWPFPGFVDSVRITNGIARHTTAYTVDPSAFVVGAGSFSGTILDASGAPAVRTVKAYRRDTGALVGSVVSNSSGNYSLTAVYGGAHDLVCLDSSGSLPDLILSRVTPV